MVKKIAKRYSVYPARAAGLIDIYSCIWQGLIPFGAQLLLAGSLARLSPFEIIPYTWYPMALFVVATFSIIFQWPLPRNKAAS
jgi:Na+/H+ antiporter NhaC